MIFLVVSVANSSSKQHFKGKVRKNARAKALCRNCPGVFSILEKAPERFFYMRKNATTTIFFCHEYFFLWRFFYSGKNAPDFFKLFSISTIFLSAFFLIWKKCPWFFQTFFHKYYFSVDVFSNVEKAPLFFFNKKDCIVNIVNVSNIVNKQFFQI